MRPVYARLAALGVGAALGAGTLPTFSAWLDTAVSPAANVVSLRDWTAPVIERAVVQKTDGGVPGFVRPNGTYHVCGRVAADTGNPPSLLRDVQSDLVAATTGFVNAVLGGRVATGPCATGTTPDNYDSGQRIANSGLTGAQTGVLRARDNDGNVRTATLEATIDGTVPNVSAAGAEWSSTNKAGGAPGLAEKDDTFSFTFSEPIDPHSVISGWNGSATTVDVQLYDGSPPASDRIVVRRNGAVIPLHTTTSFIRLNGNYTNNTVNFNGSSLVWSGNSFVITLSAPDLPDRLQPVSTATNVSWPVPATTLKDRAWNVLAGNVSDSETDSDVEF